jgi:hypothetical protein
MSGHQLLCRDSLLPSVPTVGGFAFGNVLHCDPGPARDEGHNLLLHHPSTVAPILHDLARSLHGPRLAIHGDAG